MVFRAVAYQKKLQEAGVDAKVAQTHAEAMEEFVVREIVTNDHLDAKLAHIDVKFAQLDVRFAQLDVRFAQLESKLVDLELRIIRWVVGSVGAAAVGIVVTILVALLRFPR